MPEQTISPQENFAPKQDSLSPIGRVLDVFVAPSKTFDAVKQRPGWWVPLLIGVAVGVVFAWTVVHTIGVPTLVDGIIHQSTSLDERVSGATPEAAAAIRAAVAKQLTITLYLGPVLTLIVGLRVAAVLLASANFIAGGRATFSQMLGVWFYGTLPLTLFYVVAIVAIFAGLGGDQFNLQNPVGTNIGFYLAGGESPKWLVALLSSVDIFAIWTAIVLTIGVSIVAGIKRGAAGAIVFGWWLLVVAIKVAAAVVGG